MEGQEEESWVQTLSLSCSCVRPDMPFTLSGLHTPPLLPLHKFTPKVRLKSDSAHQRAYSRTTYTYCDFIAILIVNSTVDV